MHAHAHAKRKHLKQPGDLPEQTNSQAKLNLQEPLNVNDRVLIKSRFPLFRTEIGESAIHWPIAKRHSFTPGGGMGVVGQKPPGDGNVVPPTHPWIEKFRWNKSLVSALTTKLNNKQTEVTSHTSVCISKTLCVCLSDLRSQTSKRRQDNATTQKTRQGRSGDKETQRGKNVDWPLDKRAWGRWHSHL